MEVYILDSLLRRVEVVDKFESVIWTERFSDIGDLQIEIESSLESRSQFTTGTKLAINGSYRVMVVETVEDKTSSDGKKLLSVKGSSLETLLEDRVVKNTMSDLTTEPNWVIVDTPANVARTMFDHICRDGSLDLADIIPLLQPGTIFPDSTIPESETEIVWAQAPDSLLNAEKSLCDLYDMGFRLVRNFDMSQLYFDIYTGNDLTTRQTTFSPVVFSAELDSLDNTTEFSTIDKSKNVAYVFSPAGFKVVYGENVDPLVAGFERRVLVVNASDVTADNPDVDGALQQKGFEALQSKRAMSLFDGEISQYGAFKYGRDYELGDLVELRNKDGIITYKRVTEQIFVCDSQGERSYPTLSMDLFAGEDTWLYYATKTTVWEDFTTEFWADM